MPFTADDLAAIDRAIKSGELRVKFADGREVQYRSMDELLKARALVQGEVGTSTGCKRVRQIRLYSDKGFGC